MGKTSVGRMLRDQGIERVSQGHEEWLAKVRAYAWVIARGKGYVSINDLRPQFTLPPGAHHNLWGSVFMTSDFVPVGITHAVHHASHARAVREYMLTDAGVDLTSKIESTA
jgi:hypothetical protein